ncbi:beta-catenin-interacting protein 1 isoform X1 [Sagmatias obliquidens]|uniref:beta-catenin-interacting protein 1 isoform X1 n=1 Tax=Sagmatias obliquidens TaxID=3371155 RepID=UPI000F443C7B|nr:beta-catenin-interacting protein 1 isoform X1 [Lagenorhynchus obliquidens]XP_026966065.1 beta-catenin-interacting protein 1 isoform X1 [Lagenorhynchus obliquidens]XP_026966066.1 beta-catenin-interacting protein 1 isoform X1 [Lagenorhynchus obliquidens]XP_026966067.1 beta-catenin-interacting protein 1 isoform X1 [Lagenorhynchus obliquidens]
MNREGAPGKSPEEMYIQQKVRVLLMLRKMGSNLTASEEEFLRTYAGVVSSQLSQLPQHSIDQESVAPALPDGWSTRERFRGGSSHTHRAEPQLAAASRRGACRASRASRPVPSPSPAGSQGPNQPPRLVPGCSPGPEDHPAAILSPWSAGAEDVVMAFSRSEPEDRRQ